MRKVTMFLLAGLALVAACATVAPLSDVVAQQSDEQVAERTAVRATVVLAEPVGVVKWVPARPAASHGIAEGAACGEATRHWQIVLGIGGLADGTGLTAVYLGRVPARRGNLNRGMQHIGPTAAGTKQNSAPQGSTGRLMFAVTGGDVARNVIRNPVQQAAWLADTSCPDCDKRPDGQDCPECKSCPDCEHHQPLPTQVENDILQIRRHLGLDLLSGTALEEQPDCAAAHARHHGDECKQCNESQFVEALRSITIEAVPTIGLIRRFERMLDRHDPASKQAVPLELVDVPSPDEQRHEFEFEIQGKSTPYSPRDGASYGGGNPYGESAPYSSGVCANGNCPTASRGPHDVTGGYGGYAAPSGGYSMAPNVVTPSSFPPPDGRPNHSGPILPNPYFEPTHTYVYPAMPAQPQSHSEPGDHVGVYRSTVNMHEPEPYHHPQDHDRLVNELRDVCRNIENQANRLEDAELYGQADRLREMANELRHQARRARSEAATARQATGMDADAAKFQYFVPMGR